MFDLIAKTSSCGTRSVYRSRLKTRNVTSWPNMLAFPAVVVNDDSDLPVVIVSRDNDSTIKFVYVES